ncbi:MAG TPA: TonB-dependent receptor [Caulobacteraceae bacterium]|nr:TonB-dependent receptor [Caulobacteraceae bacterium]
MSISKTRARALLMAATALASMTCASRAMAQDAAASPAAGDSQVIVTVSRTTRSAVAFSGAEAQKILPGISPLKAVESLPGVVYETADPWGNNEQNEALVVHGFTTQQLGYTMDDVPLGDQQYGNYNGLSTSRAITSENVERVTLESGAGGLGVASTSNLGGAIETFSSDPSKLMGFDLRETVGSYATTRTFGRFDTGQQDLLAGGEAYVSYLHHDARAWDFDGHQRDDQANAKYVHDDAAGKLTLFADWDNKVEPNEDATAFAGAQTAAARAYTPATRPFIYPNVQQCAAYLAPSAANGNLPGSPPTAVGNNFTNCFSAAQRTDILLYGKYDWNLTPDMVWSNQVYYHYNYGRGIVAGPVNQAGLPGLFAAYYPSLVVGTTGSAATLQNIANVFGGTGNEVRTTEYRINRGGEVSTLKWRLGDHQIEAGVWWEHNEDAQHRVWYPFSAANNDLSPYDVPNGPKAFTQYYAQFHVNDEQLHIQDQWRVLPNLLLQAGWKASLQAADGKFPINQVNAASVSPTSTSFVHYPSGSISSNDWFLPQVGAVWDATANTQVFFNVQKNMRQFIPYGAGSNFYGFSPWSLGNQAAFDLFKSTVKPETSWTYEGGVRGHTGLDWGFISGVEGQASVYHVNFANRLLNIAPYNFINPAPAVLENVGGVTTNGVDVAATVHFGPHFQAYDAISYNKSTYDSSYSSGVTSSGAPAVVPTAGKWVPLTPDWLEKFIVSTNWGPFEAQLNGDYIGRRFVTYTNDLSVPATFQVGLEASYAFTVPQISAIKSAKISLNVTNLGNTKGISTAVVSGATATQGYTAYPIAPTMGFVTLQAKF